MKRILVTGAGGAPALNFVRSLRMAPEPFHLIGIDTNKYYLQRAETDERHLAPRAADADYIPFLCDLTEETGAELIFAQPDPEIAVLSERREELQTRTFLPAKETVRLLQDKYASNRRWTEAGLKTPATSMVNGPEDIDTAFRSWGAPVWLRPVIGAAGRGALPAQDSLEARAWLDFNKGWGRYTAAEYLSPQSVTWQSIWKDGELVVAQGRRRLYWEFGDRAPSGVTGLTGAGVTVSDPQVDEIALRSIQAVDEHPHGIFAVDLTYDREGVPNPTEINIGRFFTTHLFFTAAGLNMPYIYVKLAFDEEPPPIPARVNPLRPGLVWVRGIDKEPVLTTEQEIDRFLPELEERRAWTRARTTVGKRKDPSRLPMKSEVPQSVRSDLGTSSGGTN